MAQVINTNIASLNAQRNLNKSQGMLATSLQRLSSGMRINSAKDDAAGLAISERFTAQIRGLNQAARNANDGISLAQTAEGALGEVTNNLQRIRELAVQSTNATNSSSDRVAMQQEVSQLISEIDRVSTQTNFNGVKLLDGSFTAQKFQVGANVGETITIDKVINSTKVGLGLDGTEAKLQANTTKVSGDLSGTDLKINGTAITATTQDAKLIADKITSLVTGVTATASAATLAVGAFTTQTVASGATGALKITVDGTDISATTGTGVDLTAADMDSALAGLGGAGVVNGDVSYTGSFSGGDLVFTKSDGSTIKMVTSGTGGVVDKNGYGAIDSITSTGADLVISGDNAANAGLSSSSVAQSLSVNTVADANAVITAIDAALDKVNGSRATLGAVQNRFESVVTSLQTSSESLSAARSRIQDTDFAAETANLTKSQILQQAGMAMMSQANSLPQNVLSLLQ